MRGRSRASRRSYALQAGREIRVIVEPREVDDDGAALLSHEIAREIEDQLEYPGQVKVTVIRESRAIDVASERLERQLTRGDASDSRHISGAAGAARSRGVTLGSLRQRRPPHRV